VLDRRFLLLRPQSVIGICENRGVRHQLLLRCAGSLLPAAASAKRNWYL